MDYHHFDNDFWDWQGEDIFLQADTHLGDVSKCAWTDVTQNEDISYLFEETTPIKACGELTYHFNDSEIMTKTPQECREYSPQTKRRRVLDFSNDCQDVSTSFLKSKERIDACGVVLPDIDVLMEVSDEFSPLSVEDMGHSEAWLAVADCLNDTNLNICSDSGVAPVSPDVQIDMKEAHSVTPDPASHPVQRPVRSSRKVFKGRKSYMWTPSKVASCVAYPFDYIKPCGVRGDVTLEDINQRIRTPLRLKPKEEEETVYPTSAFSGKPVVGKTKIPTHGHGSITIMRTKG